MLVFQGESAANDLCFTADGANVLAARAGGLVDAWELATGTRVSLLGPRNVEDVSRTEPPRVNLCASGFALRSYRYGPVEFAHVDGRIDRFDQPSQWAVFPLSDERLLVHTYHEGVSKRASYTFNGKCQWSVHCELNDDALASFGTDRFLTSCANHVRVRSASSGQIETDVFYRSNYIRSFAVSPDLTRVASMGWDRLYLFDATTWATPTIVTGFSVPILSMAYHPARPVLATVQSQQTLVKYLDANTGKAIKKFAWKLGPMRAVAFSADGALAAASAADGRIVVWDADL